MDLTSGECGSRMSHIGYRSQKSISLAYQASMVFQKSISLAYQASMVLSPTSGGGKGTFPWDAHLQILAHDLLHGFFPSCHSQTFSAR